MGAEDGEGEQNRVFVCVMVVVGGACSYAACGARMLAWMRCSSAGRAHSCIHACVDAGAGSVCPMLMPMPSAWRQASSACARAVQGRARPACTHRVHVCMCQRWGRPFKRAMPPHLTRRCLYPPPLLPPPFPARRSRWCTTRATRAARTATSSLSGWATARSASSTAWRSGYATTSGPTRCPTTARPG